MKDEKDLDDLSLQIARKIWDNMNADDQRDIASKGSSSWREGIASWPMWNEDSEPSSLSDEEQQKVLDGILEYLKALGNTVGYWARDRFDGMGLHYPDAASAEEAAKQYLEDGATLEAVGDSRPRRREPSARPSQRLREDTGRPTAFGMIFRLADGAGLYILTVCPSAPTGSGSIPPPPSAGGWPSSSATPAGCGTGRWK